MPTHSWFIGHGKFAELHAQLKSCNRDHMAHTAEHINWLFTSKHLLTPTLVAETNEWEMDQSCFLRDAWSPVKGQGFLGWRDCPWGHQ